MVQALQIAALLMVAAAWAFALAHAAELPGKMRLDRAQYLAVQQIYYPGFTIGGAAEPLAIVTLSALLLVTPGTNAWIVVALAATTATQLVYWLATHPVNRRWIALQGSTGIEMGKASRTLFGAGKDAAGQDWTELRDRWERSHVLRAGLMTGALVALAIALTGGR